MHWCRKVPPSLPPPHKPEMFGAVGTCVAMANGSDTLKAAATHQCGPCAEDGIYHFCADNGLI